MTSAQTPGVGLKSILLAYDFSETSRKPAPPCDCDCSNTSKPKLYIAYVVSSIGYEINGTGSIAIGLRRKRQRCSSLGRRRLLKSGALAGLQYELMDP